MSTYQYIEPFLGPGYFTIWCLCFNRKVRKEGAKNTKLSYCLNGLCDLCVFPLRPLRLVFTF